MKYPALETILATENPNNNCSISKDDVFRLYLNDAEKTKENFGEDYLVEFGFELPPELIERYKKNFEEFKAIQEELYKYFNL